MLTQQDGYEGGNVERLAVSNVAVGFDTEYLRPTSGNYKGMVARQVYISCENASLRFCIHGEDPTSTTGHELVKKQSATITGSNNLKKFKAIRVSSDAVLFTTFLY